jgi:glycosyltransferase involved in cell wall biosynthesis
MKVAFVCNMNNHPSSMVRHLREKGVDAHLLLLNNEDTHFHPSFDMFDLSYQTYTHRLEWGDHMRFTSVSPATVRRDLSPYGFVFASGSVPAFMHRAGMIADMFVPYGSDLAELPFFTPSPPRRGALTSPLVFPHAQRAGIREAHTLGGSYTPQFEGLFAKLGCTGKRIAFPLAPIHATTFNPDSLPSYYDRSAWYHEFLRIRQAHDVIVFHHARHIWRVPYSAFSQKGNDRLIRGFAKFTAEHPELRTALVILEYGPDVEASRALVAELGIKRNVFWFPLMARKEVLVGISLADIVCGEFGLSWNFCGTIIEGIALGKPLLHYRDDAMYPKEDLFPIMPGRSTDEIAAILGDYVARPEHYRHIGAEARRWFQTRILDASMDRIIELIETRN